MHLSEATLRSLGMKQNAPKASSTSLTLGFIIEVVDEPLGRPAEILDVIAQGMSGKRPPNKWLQRRKTVSHVEGTVDGLLTYRGRACCFEHLCRTERDLVHRHDLPIETTCLECSTVYRIRHGVIATKR